MHQTVPLAIPPSTVAPRSGRILCTASGSRKEFPTCTRVDDFDFRDGVGDNKLDTVYNSELPPSELEVEFQPTVYTNTLTREKKGDSGTK